MKNQQPLPNATLIILLASILSLTPFAVDMYLPGFAVISKDLLASTGQMQMSISLFLVVFGLGQLVFGPISDALGRKPLVSYGLVLFAFSSFVAATSTSIEQLLLARFAQALSGAACSVAVLATVRDYFSHNDLAKATSYLTMVIVISPILAPSLGAQILHLLSWPWIFFSLTFIAIINLTLYLWVMPESLTTKNQQPLNLVKALRNYITILSNKVSVSYLLISAFSSSSMFVFITASSFVYIDYYGASATDFGLLFAANVALMFVMSLLNAKLLNWFNWQTLLFLGMLIRIVPIILLVLLAFIDRPPLEWLVACIVANIGLSPLVSANAQAGLLNQYAKLAGSAAALAGGGRFFIGGLAGFSISVFSMQSHTIMCLAMSLCSLLMLASYLFLLRQPESK